jgi:membrane-associated phospholipid phosphatase
MAESLPDSYRRLLICSAFGLAVTAVLVLVCYFYVDRPVSYFVARRKITGTGGLVWLTEPPPLVQAWSPLVAVMILVAWAWRTPRRWQRVVLVACLTLIVADQARESLGDLCGRDWPETWHDDNPSLIGTGAYGFHPFQTGDDVGSFPSGHAARIAAFLGVFWLAYPRWRIACLLLGLPLVASLVALNYHFVSDVIAGTCLGAIAAAYAARFANLRETDLRACAAK